MCRILSEDCTNNITPVNNIEVSHQVEIERCIKHIIANRMSNNNLFLGQTAPLSKIKSKYKYTSINPAVKRSGRQHLNPDLRYRGGKMKPNCNNDFSIHLPRRAPSTAGVACGQRNLHCQLLKGAVVFAVSKCISITGGGVDIRKHMKWNWDRRVVHVNV